jgi:hypothetical protein
MVIMHLRAAAAVDARLRSHRLPNGLKVLVQEIRMAPIASVWCWYASAQVMKRRVAQGYRTGSST